MKHQSKLILLISLLCVGALLATAIGVMGAPDDPPFTLAGLLSVTGTPPVFSVKGQVLVVDSTTICTDLTPTIVPCESLNGQLVEAKGTINSIDHKYYAESITAKPTDTIFLYAGELKALSDTEWKIDDFIFKVGLTTIKPPFYALGDKVEAAFTVDITTEDYLAKELKVLDSGPENTYTYSGALSIVDMDTWKIGLYDFEVSDAVKPPFFAEGDTVEVVFDIQESKNVAIEITVLDSGEGNSYTHSGVLEEISGDIWTVDGYAFVVSDEVKPPFFLEGDTVEVVFHIAEGSNIADQVTVLNSGEGNEYKYTGELTAFDDTTWTVGEYTFILGENISLPPYFGVHDIVEVTFKIVEGDYVATAVKVIQTFVPPKTETERCMNRIKDHPGVLKLAREVGEDPEKVMEYFCSGYGLGEIKLAFRHAEGSEYTPAMLLALRSTGLGWGELKKTAAGMPADEDDDQEDQEDSGQDVLQAQNKEQHQEQDHGNSDNRPEHAGKPDNNENGPKDEKSNSGNGPDLDKSNNGKGPDKVKTNNGKNK